MDDIPPRISVLLPAYNAAKYLGEAIDSILAQSYSDFELIIINDGSTDDTERIVSAFSDKRIVYVKNEQNIGLANTLNKGINLARGEYIARMDADDISLLQRFQRQVDFLDNNKDFILCSTAIKVFGAVEERVIMATSCYEQLKVDMLFGSNIAHPAVMFRRQEFIDNNLYYRQEECPAEDYALWTRVVFVGKVCNIPEVLLHYRIHPSQVTSTNNSIGVVCQNARAVYLRSIICGIDDMHVNAFVNHSSINYDKLQLINETIKMLLAEGFFDNRKAKYTLNRFYQSIVVKLLQSDKTLSKRQKVALFSSLRLATKFRLLFNK